MEFRSRIASLAFALLLATGLAAPAGAAPAPSQGPPASSPAAQVVERFHDALLGAMKNGPALGYRGRVDAMAPAIARTFNLVQMTQISVGPYWGKLDSGQREALVESFSRLTVATYANRFDHYSGQAFRIAGEPQPRGDAVLVPAEIVRSNGEAVPIAYYMRRFDAGWQVVDIFLKGAISEMATRRSEYSSVLQRSGVEGLIRAIDEKAKAYAGA